MPDTTPLVPAQIEVPRNFLKGVLKEFYKEKKEGGYFGEELFARITEKLEEIGIRVPYIVPIAYKIAVLRDHMDEIDPEVFQNAIEEILAQRKIVDFLNRPDVKSALSTEEGMTEITNILIEIFQRAQEKADTAEVKRGTAETRDGIRSIK